MKTTPRNSPHGNQKLEERRSISPYAKASPKLSSSKLSPNTTTTTASAAKTAKRRRQESESSGTNDEAHPRPGKRKCSESAAELIKACMGVEDSVKTKLTTAKEEQAKRGFSVMARAKKGVY